MNMKRVAVIGGGRSGEHEVSLNSAASAVEALATTGRWEVVPLTVERDGSWRDPHGRSIGVAEAIGLIRGCAVALPLLHGPQGEDGAMAGLLEFAGVRYAGSPVGAGAIAMDKWVTKLVAQAIGLTTAPGTLLTARTAAEYRWTQPVVVKPVASGSSLGVTLADTAEGLRPAIDEALRFDDRVLVESLIVGREVDVAVLGRADGSRVVAPALEIVSAGLFDYATKYDGSAEFRVPAALEDVQRKALEKAATEIYDALGCRGVCRVDFFVTPFGLVLNEVNTTPGFTAQSQAPRMFAAGGIGYPELLGMLLDDALAG
jgi:D-alanine-D-alanine ligase